MDKWKKKNIIVSVNLESRVIPDKFYLIMVKLRFRINVIVKVMWVTVTFHLLSGPGLELGS